MIPAPTARRGTGALARLLACSFCCACSASFEPGVHVELISQRTVAAGQELPAGSEVLRVEELRWTSSEIELEPCDSVYSSAVRWLLPEARAHGSSSPTRSASPFIVTATATDATLMGELEPPPGRYCSLRYRVAPADEDALGLTSAPDMLDRSFWLRGAAGPTTDDLRPFELVSRRALDVTLAVDLDLSTEHPQASVQFRLDPQRWLAGLSPSDLATGTGEVAFIEAFRAGLSVRVE
jgi:hypothetical protein